MGKTKLIKEIIARKLRFEPQLNVYHVDTKKTGDFTSADGDVYIGNVAPDAFKTTGNKMVWRPLSDNRNEYDKFFKRILDAQLPSIVNIDECVNMKFRDEIPRELAILLFQGRASGINVIGGTQRVAKSPAELRSQATFIVSFLLKDKYDKATMLELLELDNQRSLDLKKYEFYYLNTDTDTPAKKFSSYEKFMHLVH